MLELSTLKAKTVTVTDQAGNVLYTLPTTVGEPGQGLRLDAQMNLVWSDMTPPRYFFSHAYEELVHKNDKTYTLTTTVPSKFSSHIYDYNGEMIWGVQSGKLVKNGPEIYFETAGTYTMEFDFATMTYSITFSTMIEDFESGVSGLELLINAYNVDIVRVNNGAFLSINSEYPGFAVKFDATVDFAVSKKIQMTINQTSKVGASIKLKLENTDNGSYVEAEVTTTTVDATETIQFDFSTASNTLTFNKIYLGWSETYLYYLYIDTIKYIL